MLRKEMCGLPLLLFICTTLSSCAQNEYSTQCNKEVLTLNEDSVSPNDDFIDTVKLNVRLHPQGEYAEVLNEVAMMRLEFENKLSAEMDDEDSLLKQAGIYLEEKIVNALLPFWYGTPWDFNGITDTPGTGKIACGYLVSTVLKHCGFNLNRYTLAQQSAWNEARTLQMSNKVKYF